MLTYINCLFIRHSTTTLQNISFTLTVYNWFIDFQWYLATCFGLWEAIIRQIKNLRGFSPKANYTDRATAACRRSYCQLLRIESVAWSAQLIPTAFNLGVLDPESLLFHSSSSSVIVTRLSGPRSRKSGSAGNRTPTSGFVARNSDHQTTEAVHQADIH
jgi:hypothetical protein